MRKIVFLFVCFSLISALCGLFAQESNFRYLIEKPVFRFEPVDDIELFKEEPLYHLNQLIVDFKFKEFEPMINAGMIISPSQKVPINLPLCSRQIYLFKTESGKVYTVISKAPVALPMPFDLQEYGASMSSDFNKALYYITHPGAKSQAKRTLKYRELITKFVYTN